MRLCVLGVCAALWLARLGWAVEVRTEGNGTIAKNTGELNKNGAMVWSGNEWVVSETWAHKYFVDSVTGKRLKEYTTKVFQSNTVETLSPYINYSVIRAIYSYQKAVPNGAYRFNAVEYKITDRVTSKVVILRSRGLGTGTANSYFDIYIDDDVTAGVNKQITALRSDPMWFTFVRPPAMSAEQSLMDIVPVKMGDLPASSGNYFLDVGGGADMGGKSHQFHTAALTVADPSLSLGSSFAVDYSLKWMDSAGNLQEMRFLPYADGAFVKDPTVPKPVISAGGVVNAWNFQPAFSDASWVSIFGANLASATRTWRGEEIVGGKLPVALDGVSVTINNKPAYVYFISPNQLNVQAPSDAGSGPVEVRVTTAGGVSDAVMVTKQSLAPAFFTWAGTVADGGKYLGAVISDGTFAGKTGLLGAIGITTRPVKPGEIVLLFGTGFGNVSPEIPAGQVVAAPARMTMPLVIRIGGKLAEVLDTGYLIFPGEYQFNVRVPELTDGDHPVVAEMGSYRTGDNVSLTVRR